MSEEYRMLTVGVLVVISIPLLILLALWPIKVARSRGHASKEAITVCTVVGLFVWPAWVVALVWAYTGPDNGAATRELIARKKLQAYTRGFPVKEQRKRYDEEPAAPSPVTEDAFVQMLDRPISRKYRIAGIDRASKLETTGYYEASTEANARAKAELDGVLITECEEVE